MASFSAHTPDRNPQGGDPQGLRAKHESGITSNPSRPSDTELVSNGYAPGDYNCICHKCQCVFFGHKRAITCPDCAASLRAIQTQGDGE